MKLRLSVLNKPNLKQLHNSSLNHNCKVRKLRQLVATLGALNIKLVRMFFGGKQLEDDKTLLSYHIKENSLITVTLGVTPAVKEDCSKKIIQRALFQPKNKVLARCQKYWCWVPAQVKAVRVDESIKGSTTSFLYTIEYLDPCPKDIEKVVEVYKTDIRGALLAPSRDVELQPRSVVMVTYSLLDEYPKPQQFDAYILKVTKVERSKDPNLELDLIVGLTNRLRVSIRRSKANIKMLPRVELIDEDEEYDSDRGGTIRELDERDNVSGGNGGRVAADQKTCDFCVGRRNVKNCTSCGCAVCGEKNSQPRVYCDECLYPYHNQCADVPVGHVGDWYCKECNNEEVDKEMKKIEKKTKKRKRGGKENEKVEEEEENEEEEVTVGTPAKKKAKNWGSGMATAARNKVCKRVPITHVGKIPGVLVGSSWRYRITCSESGVHRAPVAGIHGTVKTAMSIVISGGYDDDVDNGDWFIYSGSGGRVLSNNARTAEQSHDQALQKSNLGLALTCDAPFSNSGAEAKNWKNSQPVRVVRSCKAQKIGKYAPTTGNRYDGLYKLKKYWPSTGKSGHKVYLFEFHRDDNEPAPWTKEGKDVIRKHGLKMEWPLDDPRNPKNEDPMTSQPIEYRMCKKVKAAIAKDGLNKRNWDEVIAAAKLGFKKYYDHVEQTFLCGICMNLLVDPVTLKCGHNFCVSCRTKSVKKGMTKCPTCRRDGPDTVEVNKNLKQALEVVWAADI